MAPAAAANRRASLTVTYHDTSNGMHQRCGAATYAFERIELKTRRAGLSETGVRRAKNSHKMRGQAIKQTPHQFMDALEKTKTVVDIIRQPTPLGGAYHQRLEHRLEHLIGEGVEGDPEDVETGKIKVLPLEKKTFATIQTADGQHVYCVDFPKRRHKCEFKIEIWSATESNGIRFYVSRCVCM